MYQQIQKICIFLRSRSTRDGFFVPLQIDMKQDINEEIRDMETHILRKGFFSVDHGTVLDLG